FIGAVTSVTCDLQPEVSGAVGATVQLGTVEASGTGSAVEFSLKTVAGQAGCASLTGKTATITWAGNLTAQGVGNQGGRATDAWVELKGVNSAATTPVTASSSRVEFEGNKINSEGAKFTAALKAGTAVGDFKSVTAFVVAYN
ncbi:fimbrial protein, partial [Aeromonas jandaei]